MSIHRAPFLAAQERLAFRSACNAVIACVPLLAVNAEGAEPQQSVGRTIATAWVAPGVESATPAELQSLYLECDRMAMTTTLDFGAAGYCSVVYETLKATVFGGSFNRLLEWDRARRKAPLRD